MKDNKRLVADNEREVLRLFSQENKKWRFRPAQSGQVHSVCLCESLWNSLRGRHL